jgi:hypothetical protein
VQSRISPRDMSPPGAPVRIAYNRRTYPIPENFWSMPNPPRVTARTPEQNRNNGRDPRDESPPPHRHAPRRARRAPTLSPDDSRLEAPRIHATLGSRQLIEPSEYLPEGVIRFEDLRLDNDVGSEGPSREESLRQMFQDSYRRFRAPAGAGDMEVDHVVHTQEGNADPIPEAVGNAAVEAFLRRAHERPIPQPEPGKCSALHQWVCEFIDARDDDASTEAKAVQQAKTAAEESQVATELVSEKEAPADQGPFAKPPKCFFCPISHQALRDPVVASDGNTYERNFLSIQFSRNDYKSPLTREPLQPVFFPNRAIAEAMHNWAMTQNPPENVE